MNRKKTIIITIILCVLIMGAGVGFQFYTREKMFSPQRESTEEVSVAVEEPPEEAPDAQEEAPDTDEDQRAESSVLEVLPESSGVSGSQDEEVSDGENSGDGASGEESDPDA